MASYNLGTASGRIVIDGSGAEKGFAVATVAANTFFGVVQSKLDSVRQLGDNLIKLGATGSVGMGLATRAAANFEQRLSAIKAVSGASASEMDKVSKAALRIGKDTVFSASEAAQAMEELVKAGVSIPDVLNGAADAVVNLAAAGEIALPRAAEIAANAMNNFNLKGRDMPKVADLIAGAANASAISVEEFGMSLSQSGAVASIAGLKFDDLAVAIAEMGNAGIKGSDAGTSIKTFLTNLIPVTDQQIAKFKELGLATFSSTKAHVALAKLGLKPVGEGLQGTLKTLGQYVEAHNGAKVGTQANAKAAAEMAQKMGIMSNQFFDANGNIKSMADIQQVLANATKGMTREQKLATLELLFGSDAIRAAAVLSDEGAAGYNKMAAAMGKVGAADVARTRMDNLNGSIEQLKGSFETAMITIGQVFLPVVRMIVDGINSIVNIFNSLPAPIQQAIAIIFGLGSALTLLGGIFIKLAFLLVPMLARFLGLQALKGVFSILTVGFKAMRGGAGVMGALSAALARGGVVFSRIAKVATFLFKTLVRIPGVLGAIRAVAAFAFGPWGIAIALVTTALILLYKHFAPFRDLVDRVAAAIRGGLLTAWNAIKAAFAAVLPYLKQIGDAFMNSVIPALKAAGGTIFKAIINGWNQIKAAVSGQLVPALQQVASVFMTQVVPALKQLWTAIGPVVIFIGKLVAIIVGGLLFALFQLAKAFVTYVLPAVIKFVAIIISVLIPILTTIISVLITVISGIIRFAAALISIFVGAITFVVKAVVAFGNMLVQSFIIAFNTIKGWIVAAWEFIKMVFQAALAFVLSIWNAYWKLFGPLVMAVFGLIQAIITLAMRIIQFVIFGTLKVILAIWNAVWNGVKMVAMAVWGIIYTFVASKVNALRSIVSTVVSAIASFVSSRWNNLRNNTVAAWNAVWAAVSGPINRVRALVSSVTNTVRSAVSSAWNSVRSITSSVWSSVSSTIGAKINEAKAKVSGAISAIKGLFSGAGGWLIQAGRNIIQGLINGITSMISKVTGLLSKLTSMIPKLKGPEERDKKLLRNNGQLIMQGLIKGFNDEEANLIKTLVDLTKNIPANVKMPNMTASMAMAGVTPARPSAPPGLAVAEQKRPDIHVEFKAYNPVAERASETAVKEITRIAALGVFS